MVMRMTRMMRWLRSPLTQGRGLKQVDGCIAFCFKRVAPHAGAWIETPRRLDRFCDSRSPLTQGRGLKHCDFVAMALNSSVAPHAGAWIETSGSTAVHASPGVAPHAGAWIETGRRDKRFANATGRPSRRGVD